MELAKRTGRRLMNDSSFPVSSFGSSLTFSFCSLPFLFVSQPTFSVVRTVLAETSSSLGPVFSFFLFTANNIFRMLTTLGIGFLETPRRPKTALFTEMERFSSSKRSPLLNRSSPFFVRKAIKAGSAKRSSL